MRKQWKKMTDLVSTTETNRFRVYIKSIQMVTQLTINNLFDIFYQKNTRKIGRNLYEVSYNIESNNYKMLIEPLKGPAPVLQISNNLNEDITTDVLSYMGPQYDWHSLSHINNKRFNPANFFNCDYLLFELSDGNTETIYAVGKEPSSKKEE